MNAVSDQGMVDILMLEPVVDYRAFYFSVIVFFALVFLLAFIFFKRYRNQPLRRLRRQLLSKQLSPRECAQVLTQLTTLDSKQAAQLKKMSFAKAEPTSQQLLEFMSRINSL